MRKWVRSEHSDVAKPERWILPSITSSDKSSAAQGTKATLTYFQRKHFIDCFFPHYIIQLISSPQFFFHAAQNEFMKDWQ